MRRFSVYSLVCLLALSNLSYAAPFGFGGFDPVATFQTGEPEKGKNALELLWSGRLWLFKNEGNKAAFERDPDVYAPAFGSCGIFRLSQGVKVEGSPTVFAFYKEKLLLFYGRQDRVLFFANHETLWENAKLHAEKVDCVSVR
ncbi:twin-arginine translocation pathway signal protein [Rhodobacteraceae bacterium RKSG542]|uniref:twin-arginine translocation pathway signal protein n=1 Tax=Pseudovibrio flavus TaxID=2529854 RepID=UPI0012BC1B86|nr:twin-arginine translocation pathway signal protein [Pseudovibrio flavus]MTI16624.1 twin-arginine translocation pathway signal protein [Pseudovibrio flavus]